MHSYWPFAWPQTIIIILCIINLGVSSAEHGEPKKPPSDRYNFPMAVFRWGCLFLLLWAGGFFNGR